MTRKERIKENERVFKKFANESHKHNSENKNQHFKYNKIDSNDDVIDKNHHRHFMPKGSPHFFEELKKQHDKIKNKKELNNNEIKQHKSIKPEWFLHKIEKQKIEKENSNTSLETFESDYKTFINSLKNKEK